MGGDKENRCALVRAQGTEPRFACLFSLWGERGKVSWLSLTGEKRCDAAQLSIVRDGHPNGTKPFVGSVKLGKVRAQRNTARPDAKIKAGINRPLKRPFTRPITRDKTHNYMYYIIYFNQKHGQ
ncbi:hypothetical protein LP7551_04145 [Roseibium album]|nr:hypothetical protein LP7551_04145 [Roseibium album]